MSRRDQGLQPIGQIAAEVVADVRFRRQVLRLHRLGPRVTAELLAEIGAERGIRTVIDRKLATYAELDPKVIEVVEGAGFGPATLYEVQPNPEPPECSGNRANTRNSTA